MIENLPSLAGRTDGLRVGSLAHLMKAERRCAGSPRVSMRKRPPPPPRRTASKSSR